MNDFRDLLEVHNESEMFGHRIYKSIPIGKFEISIQGSKTHYCSPRMLVEPKRYIEMEVAIFEKEKWINPLADERFDSFDEPLNWESGEHGVGGYIPVTTIQKLCDYIENMEA